MDDGYKSNYEVAFPILKKYNMKATVFVVGSNLNLDNPIVLTKEMMDKSKKEYPNIQFASHSYGLHDSFLDDEEKLQADFDAMKGYVSTKYFAYPHGSFNEAYKNVLKKNDYKLAFAFGTSGVKFRKANRSDDNYAVARLCIINEMPMWKFILRMILPL